MRLAITMRQVVDPRHGERRDAISVDWGRYIAQLLPNAVLIPVVNSSLDAKGWAEALSLDGVILSNGNDWGEAEDRDNTETKLYNWAVSRGVPVFGACRGFQVINAILGGGIHPDISSVDKHRHDGTTHPVRLIDPLFAELAGQETMEVNSYHDQGVLLENLAPDLQAFAMNGERIVEGFFHPDQAVLGIQWHPERPCPSSTFNDALIRRFFQRGAFWR